MGAGAIVADFKPPRWLEPERHLSDYALAGNCDRSRGERRCAAAGRRQRGAVLGALLMGEPLQLRQGRAPLRRRKEAAARRGRAWFGMVVTISFGDGGSPSEALSPG
jgi:hypothetical protein